jgi:phosphoribosylamine--glycine ligase
VALARRIADPLLADLRRAGHPFRGILYLGMMLGSAGSSVLEINARFGDPEAQVVLPLLEEDPLPLFRAAAQGALPRERHGTFVAHAGAAVCVVLAARGYPEAPKRGDAIEGLDRAWPHGIRIYHAGVERRGGSWVTAGGRVLGVAARADSLTRAREAAYGAVSRIWFEGMQYRRDIAAPVHPRSGSAVP